MRGHWQSTNGRMPGAARRWLESGLVTGLKQPQHAACGTPTICTTASRHNTARKQLTWPRIAYARLEGANAVVDR